MADYYTLAQLALRVGITESEICEIESKGLIQPELKNGMRFFSSRQSYDLQVALRVSRKQKLNLEKAFAKIEEFRVRQASTILS